VQSPRGVLTYIPDHEPALGPGEILQDLKWLSGSELASGADILLHDAQYTLEEYKTKQGWGHTAMEDALQFASLTQVKKLLLMHHDPMHTDAQLDEMYRLLKENTSFPFRYEMAVEGTRIEL
jgi:ribonuclease BN (tRNA processing enzyme)